MTEQQEFEVMKLVLDKFLWFGFAIMVYGLYKSFTATLTEGLIWVVVGAVVLILFMITIVKEYEILK